MNRMSELSKRSRTKLLLLLAAMFVLAIGFGVSVGAEEIENLARGGDFENPDDIAQWGLWKAAATQGNMKIDKKNAAVGEASLYVFDIILDPLDKWKPILYRWISLSSKRKRFIPTRHFSKRKSRANLE